MRSAGTLTLTVDAGVGLSAASPKWALSIGIAEVFAGTSPGQPGVAVPAA